VMWVCWVMFFLLSYPPTDFTILAAHGPLGYHLSLTPVAFTALLFAVGIAMAVGKATVFNFIADEFPNDIGAVSGVVGL
ncbi:MFS transporter, partial [Burkholderia pseudomallei]